MKRAKVTIADLIRKSGRWLGGACPYYDTGWVSCSDWGKQPVKRITVQMPVEWIKPYCAYCGQAIPVRVQGGKP